VRFNIRSRDAMDLIDLRHPGPWQIPAARIRDINRYLLGPVVIAARQGD
jgi:hypothetical protein